MKCISKLYHNTFTDFKKKFVFHIFCAYENVLYIFITEVNLFHNYKFITWKEN